jgi:N-formylglutamate amidohydrolase
MSLPLLLAVPHAGLLVPPEVEGLCRLTPHEIAADGDSGAAAIYLPLEAEVAALVTSEVARAIVDLNRPEEDRGRDGVIKTHTCWDVPVYREPPDPATVAALLERYHRPYHRRLSELAGSGVVLGVDCHTMAACGPPAAPDPGRERPAVCLSDAGGTLPQAWFEALAESFRAAFPGLAVALNRPFRGGYTIRRHAPELPWVQLELSRAPFMDDAEKSAKVAAALAAWCRRRR